MMAKPPPEKTVAAVARRGVLVAGRRVAPGEEFQCSETDLRLMVGANQAAPAKSDEARALREGVATKAPAEGGGEKATRTRLA
jgi:hypothetical protein